MKAYLGVDVGTYETKGVIVSAEGEILASASRKHKMSTPRPGWAEHRAEEDWWADVAAVCRDCLRTAPLPAAAIRSVGLSAIGPCMLPVAASGAPLMNAVLYGVDVRAAAEINELTDRIGARPILALGGNALTSQSVGPKILWLKRNRPEIYGRAVKFVSATTYLVHKLTGVWAVDHYTAANFSPLYFAEQQRYTTALADDIVHPSRLAPLRWTTDVVGGVTPGAAEATGLAAGTPVIAGTIDAAAEAVSVGATEPGDMMMMYGSTVFMILLTTGRLRDPDLWYAPWLFKGRHAAMAGLATSGTLTHWFRDQLARDLDPVEAFAKLAGEAAASPPGANGLVVLPYFSGERTPLHDPHARGVFFGLNLTHRRADLYRALLEGVAFGARHVTDRFAQAGAPPERVLAVGGGVKNALWAQATSDIAQLEQIIREKTVGAAFGDAFLAAVGVGDLGAADITRWNPEVRRIKPSPDVARRDLYDRRYIIFRQLYAQTKDLMRALSASADV